MNSLIKTITEIREENNLLIDTSNSDRHRIIINEQNGSKTAYYFSAPIYNIDTRKLLDFKFTNNDTPRFIGSNAHITFSNNIKMSNANGICFISLRGKIQRISDFELREGENIILPTTNGFIYKVAVKSNSNPIIIKTERSFLTTRANNKCFALMIDKFTPFMYISAIGIEDSAGYIISPFTISNSKISDYEYEIHPGSLDKGNYLVFEINMYEKKLIQDTTVETSNPKSNNAFGSSAYIGTTADFGEQWLYSKIDYMRMSDISGRRIKNATVYIPKLSKSSANIVAYNVAERFCSFGSTWDNKKPEAGYVNHSINSEKYIVVDITSSIIHEKSKQLISNNGLIFKAQNKSDFVAITTGDSCFSPQIIAINYY